MSFLSQFLAANHEVVLFVYGLGFFILGFAILLQTRRSSRLELARSLRWLAAFGILHAFHEWGDLFIPLRGVQPAAAPAAYAIQVLLLAASFACMFQFGVSVLQPFRGETWVRPLPGLILAVWAFVSFFVLLPAASDLVEWHHAVNALARYFIGFPGGLLAAYGLRAHAVRRIKPLKAPVIYNTLRVVGVSLALYALLGGLFPPAADFFPANVLNTVTFESFTGIPVIVARTLLSIVIAATVIRSLEIFDLETDRTIEQLERVQIISAEHDRLARELHDGAIQKVYTGGLLVESATRLAEPGSELRQRLERSQGVLKDAVADLRRNLEELHQSDSSSAPQSPAQILAGPATDPRFNSLITIEQDLQVAPSRTLNAIRAGHMLAVVNEALANVVRHAGARKVSIRARDLGKLLCLEIEDDGLGFPPDLPAGYGVRNMRDRARLLGGDLDIASGPRRGTVVTLTLPWED